jgi:branched-chain amino acid transport system ATP-binding protein
MAVAVRPERDIVLRTIDLRVSFGGVQALKGVSVEVERGRLLGIVGPNGSGKTTLLNCISGVCRPTAGSIEVGGTNITGMAAHAITDRGVGRTFQHADVPRHLTMLELVLLGRHRLMKRHGMLAYALGVPQCTEFEEVHREAARALLEEAQLQAYANRELGELPYGVVKRADICRALAGEPSLLLLDEPAAGCNEAEREQLSDLIARLRRDTLTIALVEHDMTFVSRLAERVLVLVDGKELAEGPTAATLRGADVLEKFLGTGARSGRATGRGNRA